MSEIDRVRWHCRRGLLELHIIFTRFLDDGGYDRLTPAQREVFSEVLQFDDNHLWDLVAGRREPDDAAVAEVVTLLRRA